VSVQRHASREDATHFFFSSFLFFFFFLKSDRVKRDEEREKPSMPLFLISCPTPPELLRLFLDQSVQKKIAKNE